MESGKLKDFRIERGFGFIEPDGGGPDVFLHARDMADPAEIELLHPGAAVTWDVTMQSEKGPRALRARVLNGRRPASPPEELEFLARETFGACARLQEALRLYGWDV
jgi:cold shock protein